ncbi:MAG: helix-turn-helix transcriptional regulator [Paraglaciecola sp.]|uniref:helix-turn-helix transcriptional regulator n=1 Tax=Paraglaciecola sp. TaxID=1920173 RepID=UPI0032991129
MAKPKRFTTDEFTQKLDQEIGRLIETKQSGRELIQTDIQVNDIALAFGVNTATIRRWCKEHTALSPRQYLAIYRMERAKQFLRLGLKPAKISTKLAFTEHKVFCAVFKRYEKISPSKFNTL